MTEREKLLQHVRMHNFAMIEVGLFLDSHPKNAAALAYFQAQKAKYDAAVADYEAQLKSAMETRVKAVEDFATKKEGYDKLPDEALAALKKLVDALA